MRPRMTLRAPATYAAAGLFALGYVGIATPPESHHNDKHHKSSDSKRSRTEERQRSHHREQPAYQTAMASEYDADGGPLACGGTGQPGQNEVANLSLPCGTKVQISYGGRSVIASVEDRGPYVEGRTFDLDSEVADKLDFDGLDNVRWRVV